jgi:sugar-specific transcriptional regulator TrmB
MQLDRVVDKLRDSGMSGYEAKAYLALLTAGRPLNGYEVAKNSGVPRSTVYETLAKLVARGAAFEVRVANSDSTAYLALPAESFLAQQRREFDDNIESLATALPKVARSPKANLVHHIRGRANVVDRARELIQRAGDDLFVSIWAEEAGDLENDLRQAVRRGVDVSIVAFGDLGYEVGQFYRHAFSSPEVVLDRLGARLFVVADDRRSVLVGGAYGDDTWAMWSDDPAVVLVAVEFVRHDIAMQVLVDRLGEETVDNFWHTDPTLERLQTGRGSPGLRRQALWSAQEDK